MNKDISNKGVVSVTMRKPWFLLMAGLVLSGCANELENVQKQIDGVEETKAEMIGSLNAINQYESDMQADLDASLIDDEELSALKNGSAVVFENIDNRQEEVDQMENQLKDFKKSAEDLKSFDDESLPLGSIQSVLQPMEMMIEQLDTYLPAYKDQLASEQETFEAFGADDADFNTLFEGFESLNSTSDSNLDLLAPFAETNEELDASIQNLKKELTALEEE